MCSFFSDLEINSNVKGLKERKHTSIDWNAKKKNVWTEAVRKRDVKLKWAQGQVFMKGGATDLYSNNASHLLYVSCYYKYFEIVCSGVFCYIFDTFFDR